MRERTARRALGALAYGGSLRLSPIGYPTAKLRRAFGTCARGGGAAPTPSLRPFHYKKRDGRYSLRSLRRSLRSVRFLFSRSIPLLG